MQIILRPGVLAKQAQPATATLATAKAGRHQTILTNLAATDFFVKFGAGATAGTAGVGGSFDFVLKTGAPAVVIDNYTGIITVAPVPTAGQINVSELFGSSYRK